MNFGSFFLNRFSRPSFCKNKIDDFVKVNFPLVPSFRRKPESSKFNVFWMLDQVRHDDSRTFYETIKIEAVYFQKAKLLFKKCSSNRSIWVKRSWVEYILF